MNYKNSHLLCYMYPQHNLNNWWNPLSSRCLRDKMYKKSCRFAYCIYRLDKQNKPQNQL